MVALHDVIASRFDEVLHRWNERVRGSVVPESMPPLELADHVPAFLKELIAVLREPHGLAAPGSADPQRPASIHGQHRLRLGFSVDSIVREYGALQEVIIDTATAAHARLDPDELKLLTGAITSGISRAVAEYARQRDAQLVRQTNEHFAFLAHELRNPLFSASVAFHLLKTRDEVLARSSVASSVERNLQRMEQLIEHDLQNARIASGIQLRPQTTTLHSLFEEAELAALPHAESKGVDLRIEVESDLELQLDSRLLQSALDNLVRNGVKCTPSGGTVVVRGDVADGRVTIEVEDRCGGLPPGKVEKAFAPFVRLDERESGFGLGLAIAKQAVDAHGGSIRVQNLPGTGCIFALELPASGS